jgi:hypothetical protein
MEGHDTIGLNGSRWATSECWGPIGHAVWIVKFWRECTKEEKWAVCGVKAEVREVQKAIKYISWACKSSM